MSHLTLKRRLSAVQREQLAPTGCLRIGVAVGKAISAVWSTRDAETGQLRGVTIDLGSEMAGWLDLPFEFIAHESSGHIIETAGGGRWDVAFAPVDAERKKCVDFGTNYYIGVSTYMVHAGSPIQSVEDVDSENVRVVGVENTATIRSVRRTLTKATVQGVTSLEEAINLFRSREADAIALGRESLLSLAGTLPEGRILDGHFHATGTAVATPCGRKEALALVTEFVEEAKASGLAEKILIDNGLPPESIAPPGSRS